MGKSQQTIEKYAIRANLPVNKMPHKRTYTAHAFNFLMTFI